MIVRRYWQEESGVREIVDDVGYLCNQLQRPVCSKDLAAYYKSNPGERPNMMQAFGQLLLKATYMRKRASPTLQKIGQAGNCSYYALEASPKWHEALRVHALKIRVSAQITLATPTVAQVLFESNYSVFARNAMAGYVREYLPILSDTALAGWRKLSSLNKLVRLAEQYASNGWRLLPPTDLIARENAAALIRREYAKRNPHAEASGHNVNRHLALLHWPQSHLFRANEQLVYSEAQLLAYCAARWPADMEERLVNAALWRCLAYGVLDRTAYLLNR